MAVKSFIVQAPGLEKTQHSNLLKFFVIDEAKKTLTPLSNVIKHFCP
jgi:hypothetical protein